MMSPKSAVVGFWQRSPYPLDLVGKDEEELFTMGEASRMKSFFFGSMNVAKAR